MDEFDNEIVGPVREFLDRSFTADHRTELFESHDDDLKIFAELGWFGLLAPEDEDGLGVHPAQLAAVFRVFGEKLVPGPMMEQMLVPGLVFSALKGSAEEGMEAAERLRPSLTGERRVAVADPGITLHWAEVNGSLHVRSGRLDGALELVRFGAEADELLVHAEDEHGSLVALVDSDRRGIELSARRSTDPGASFASLRCDSVIVEPGDIVARGVAARELVERIQSWSRVLVSCELAGISRHMLDLALTHIQQREQFGRTIATFQVIRQMAATAAQRVILLENFCEAIAQDALSMSEDELSIAAMALKANAAESARLVVEDALQLHGGIGFTYEYELHWYYKRALALRTWYGDERELAIQIGRRKLIA